MKRIDIFVLVLVLFSSLYAQALDKNLHKQKFQTYKKCKATRSGNVDVYPAKFASDNDLTRSEGGFYNSYNKKIIIRGVIRDKNCVPVSNAHIKMWQVDAYGKQRYLQKFSGALQKKKVDNNMYSRFQGTGMFTSLNNGEFFFITVLPSELSESKKSPRYVNFEITHDEFPSLKNKIFFLELEQFSNSTKNVLAKNFFDTRYKDIKIYDAQITLDGVSRHDEF